MNLLVLSPIGTLGGAEKCLLDLLAALRVIAPGLNVELVVLEDGPLVYEARRLGATVEIFRLPRSLATLGESGANVDRRWRDLVVAFAQLLRWFPGFWKMLRQRRADVILSNGLKTHLLGALARPPASKLVWYLHDFLSDRPMTARLLPRFRRRADLAIAISRAVASNARPILRDLRVETVLNGVQTEPFAPGVVTPADLDALAGLRTANPGTVRVGLVATYALWKGHEFFLDAARRVTNPLARFYIVGGPVYSTRGSQLTQSALRARIAASGLADRCGLVPFQHDVAPVYAALDIVVHASTRPEPFGRTIAEAMASMRTVIAARAGGVTEQVSDGETGILFEPNDAASLRAAMERCIESPELRERLAFNARAAAVERLDHVRFGREFLEKLTSLVSEHEPRSARQKPSAPALDRRH
jgi:glycosyltransferase involved in cell wall biosynthesis